MNGYAAGQGSPETVIQRNVNTALGNNMVIKNKNKNKKRIKESKSIVKGLFNRRTSNGKKGDPGGSKC
jgi:hypothetical protein